MRVWHGSGQGQYAPGGNRASSAALRRSSSIAHSFVSVGIALQLFILAVPIIWFARYSALFYFVYVTVATIAVLKIISGRYEAAYKIAWVVLVLSVPMFGAVMYLLYGGNKIDIRSQKMHQQEACMRSLDGQRHPGDKRPRWRSRGWRR